MAGSNATKGTEELVRWANAHLVKREEEELAKSKLWNHLEDDTEHWQGIPMTIGKVVYGFKLPTKESTSRFFTAMNDVAESVLGLA